MNIDKEAPLIGKKVILINAPVHHVWNIQTDINAWPKWQKDITSANLLGELKQGTTFTWKAMGMGITSALRVVAKNEIIGWSGRSLGMYALHVWKFEKQGKKTRVTTEESLSGWFPQLIRIFKPDFLEQSLTKALMTLKSEAEESRP